MEKDWEVKIKALEKKVEEQSRKISDLEDIEAIKRIKKA